jgi:hypothetical protein
MIMTKPINPIRYIIQPEVPGGEGTGDDLASGTDTGDSSTGDNNIGVVEENSNDGEENPDDGGDNSDDGGDNSDDGDGSIEAGSDSVAKALIALQSLEVPKPIALTFQ